MNLNQIAHHPEAQVVTTFTHAGLECAVLNMQDRHYCGYVKTPFDGHYEEFQDSVSVHGGLTYGLDEDGWVGFDTAHGFDIPLDRRGVPLENNPIAGLMAAMDDGMQKEWDPEDVIEETADLAEQIAEIVPAGDLQQQSELVE